MKKLIAMIILAVTLGACSKSMNDNYVGQWQMDGNGLLGDMMQQSIAKDKSIKMPIFNIVKSGEIYLVKDEGKSIIAVSSFCASGATLKDSKLICSPQFEFTFDPTTGKLLTPTLGTFTKIN